MESTFKQHLRSIAVDMYDLVGKATALSTISKCLHLQYVQIFKREGDLKISLQNLVLLLAMYFQGSYLIIPND